MNQSKSAELKEPSDGTLITSIENFRVSANVALAFAEDMVKVVIPEGRDENEHLLQMARERVINGNQLPSRFVPDAVSSELKTFKLGKLFVGASGD
ncbi:hypothetical protein MIR68_008472 [Amoeboaphelidium protococcarum]|nr:hypothetical protein MIR68_008472 [Amoeboaphelidium protococcarum]KAI3644344.1 hypothetical protein MP228_010508 [Amoeboaphelidium protococcarum]